MAEGTNQVVQRQVRIVNRQGLHARPVMRFVDVASRFQARITVQRGKRSVDGKSPMDMMLLEAAKDTELTLIARGEDAGQAVDALASLVAEGFGEE